MELTISEGDVIGDATKIIDALNNGAPGAREQLFTIVYSELRKLAAHRLMREAPGQTLQATALVHEVYLKLVCVKQHRSWEHRGHFFAAAAQAMDRILVDQIRRKKALKRGGDRKRVDAELTDLPTPVPDEVILTLHEALVELDLVKCEAANLVRLRFFAGMTNKEAAEALGVAPRSANRLWTYARAWLQEKVGDSVSMS